MSEQSEIPKADPNAGFHERVEQAIANLERVLNDKRPPISEKHYHRLRRLTEKLY